MFASAGYFPGSVAEAPADVRAGFLRKVYGYFFLTVLTSLVAGFAVAGSDSLMVAALHARLFTFLPLLLMALYLRFAIRQNSANTVVMFLFAAIIGATLAPYVTLLNRQIPGVGLQAGILTASVFGGLSWYAWFSKKDFSFLGGFLFMGLLGLVLVGLLSMFGSIFRIFPPSFVILAYCYVGVLVFSGYVLFDTSRILYRYPPTAVIPAVLALYLDIVNLFIYILQILAMNQRRRD